MFVGRLKRRGSVALRSPAPATVISPTVAAKGANRPRSWPSLPRWSSETATWFGIGRPVLILPGRRVPGNQLQEPEPNPHTARANGAARALLELTDLAWRTVNSDALPGLLPFQPALQALEQ